MAAPALRQTLSIASRTVNRTLRSWGLNHTGHVARCLSSGTASPIGPDADSRGASTNQQLALSAGHVLSKPSTTKGTDGSPCTGKSGVASASRTHGLLDSETAVEESLARLTLSPLETRLSLNMILPSRDAKPTSILDPSPSASLMLDFPAVLPAMPLCDPMSGIWEVRLPQTGNAAKKHASNIIHKRRRKMNRHQYLKWKKRNKFKLRILKQRSLKKKRLKWEQHLSQFRFSGLKPGDGEAFLAKKKEKMDIFLRYLGIQTNEEEGMKKKRGEAPEVGKVVPERPLPQGAKI